MVVRRPEEMLAESLDRVSKVLIGILLRDIEDAEQIKKIERLRSCGLSNSEIARILGTTSNTVNVAVHALKRRRRRSRKRAKK